MNKNIENNDRTYKIKSIKYVLIENKDLKQENLVLSKINQKLKKENHKLNYQLAREKTINTELESINKILTDEIKKLQDNIADLEDEQNLALKITQAEIKAEEQVRSVLYGGLLE